MRNMSMVLALLILESSLWFAGGRETADSHVYIGPAVNGRIDNGNNDVVVLGGLFPVHNVEENETGCGKIFNTSMQLLEGMVLATRNINNNDSILPGVTLAFEIRDTCALNKTGLEESVEFVSGRTLKPAGDKNGTPILGISGVVGARLSRVSTPVARLLRLFQVPQISYASTVGILSNKTTFDYFFRTLSPDSLQAQAMVDIVECFNWTYVIAMYTDDIYGREGIEAFINKFKKKNPTPRCVATSIGIPENAGADDFEEAVEKMNQEWVSNATVIVLFAQKDTAAGLFKAVKRKRENDTKLESKSFTWIGSDGWGDDVEEDLLDVVQGSLTIIPRSQASVEFDKYFQSLHPSNYTANPWFEEYWESIFNCNLNGQQGINDCDLSNQSISNETGYRQSGFVTFTIDAVYAFAHAIHNLQQDHCPGGHGLCDEILDSRGRSGGKAIRGDYLRDYLYNVSFGPAASTDVINFDSNGDQVGGYLIKNIKKVSEGEFDFVTVGSWDETLTEMLKIPGEIQWSNCQNEAPESFCSYPCGKGEYCEPVTDHEECCCVCKPCTDTHVSNDKLECLDPKYLMWSNGWSIVILILTLLGVIATIAIAIVFIVYHKHTLIKASSKELSAVLLTGIVLCYLLPFFFIDKPAPWICTIRRFGIGFCFSLCYSALLVKTNRIHRIFNRPSSSSQVPPLISPKSQLFFTTLLVAVQVIVVTVWLVVEKPSIEDENLPDQRCGFSPDIGLSVSLGYNFLLLIVTLYFAFRTRKVPQNYNEAKFINLTMYTLCILWLAFIPSYYTTVRYGVHMYQTVSLVLAIILNATVTLCILFVPKVYFIFTQEQMDNFIPPSAFTTPKHISSSDQKSFKFLCTNLPAIDSDTCNPAHSNVSTPQHNAVEQMKGSNSNKGCYGTGVGNVDQCGHRGGALHKHA